MLSIRPAGLDIRHFEHSRKPRPALGPRLAPRLKFAPFALLLAIASFDIASGLEHWPFGTYPMYSLTYRNQLNWLRLYGTAGDGAREVPLPVDRNFAPFDESRLVTALSRVPGPQLPRALRELLLLHNRNSTFPVRILRLYSVRWTLRTGITGDEPPESKILLAEVTSDAR